MGPDDDREALLAGLRRDVAGLRLVPERWADLERDAQDLDPADPASVESFRQAIFEARVQGRFRAGRATSTLPPTKQVSILPWVGLVCALILLGAGSALGGGLVLLAVGLLSIGIFVVAFAGSRVAHRRPARGRGRRETATTDGTDGVPAPDSEPEPGPPPAALLALLGGTVGE